MILITGTIRIAPQRLDDARPVMARMIAASRAEPGCRHYSYSEDLIEPGLIRVLELWTDPAALEDHFASEHIAQWRGEWQRLGITDRQLQAYDVGDPRPV